MTANTVAHDILWPSDARVVLRACFLYVGQGSSILVLVRDGKTYRVLVIDSNLDKTNGGIDVPNLVKDLVSDGKLYAFVNTHPHDDHLNGVKQIGEAVVVENVWHSGHAPSKNFGTHHPDLTKLMGEVEKRSGAGAVLEIDGSRSPKTFFDAEVHFLAPAEHVKEEVNDEDPDVRYRRIHENCAVLRFGKGNSHVLVTGDADLVAFREHITKYHQERLKAYVLDASHHGSRSFFMADEGNDPYLDALKAIDPKYVVISAPTADESRHGHPHDSAVKLYAAHVGDDNVLHTGKDRETFFFDVYEDGTGSGPQTDKGKLAEKYGLDKKEDGGDDGGSKKDGSTGPFVRPSEPGQYKPRKYAARPFGAAPATPPTHVETRRTRLQ
jgi:competence protein ComEC